jgi:hypothetical protein
MKILIVLIAVFAFAIADSAQTATSLSTQQIEALKKIKADTEKTSAPYALKLAETTKQIYANMLSDKEDQKLRKRLAKRFHEYTGKLLDIRGQSYRSALALLNPEQRQSVREELKKPGAPMDIAEVITKLFGLKEK